MKAKKFLKKIIKESAFCQRIANICDVNPHAMQYYGQNGEDIFVTNFFEKHHKGVYVDIGAHHPIRFSNTYLLYLAGWRGINIDPLPGSMSIFKKERPDDVNLEVCISEHSEDVRYFSFEEPAYNTLSEDRANEVITKGYSKLHSVINVSSETLSSILKKHIPAQSNIDLMTIDVETMELSVLRTNDWDIFLPTLIILESLVSKNCSVFEVKNDPAIAFLIEKGYSVVGKSLNAVYLVYEK